MAMMKENDEEEEENVKVDDERKTGKGEEKEEQKQKNKKKKKRKDRKKLLLMMMLMMTTRCSCYSAGRRFGQHPSVINQLEQNSRDHDNDGKSIEDQVFSWCRAGYCASVTRLPRERRVIHPLANTTAH